MKCQKIIIDTDPGIDDAMAIFFAGLSDKLDLVAMTSVFGNVTLDIATRNAMVLAEILKSENTGIKRIFKTISGRYQTQFQIMFMEKKDLEIFQHVSLNQKS